MNKHFPHLLLVTTVFALPATAIATEWTMATPYGEASFHTDNVRQFAADVAEATNGELTINVHSGGSLVAHGEIKPSVRRGTIEIGEVFLSDRKSTRLNSSHVRISYAVFCLK